MFLSLFYDKNIFEIFFKSLLNYRKFLSIFIFINYSYLFFKRIKKLNYNLLNFSSNLFFNFRFILLIEFYYYIIKLNVRLNKNYFFSDFFLDKKVFNVLKFKDKSNKKKKYIN